MTTAAQVVVPGGPSEMAEAMRTRWQAAASAMALSPEAALAGLCQFFEGREGRPMMVVEATAMVEARAAVVLVERATAGFQEAERAEGQVAGGSVAATAAAAAAAGTARATERRAEAGGARVAVAAAAELHYEAFQL